MIITLTGEQWDDRTCPSCGGSLDDEPPKECSAPEYMLLHWLAYLSEDRIFAGWHMGCQEMVVGWCQRPVPDGEPGVLMGRLTVYESEAKAVLGLVAQAQGEWRWDDVEEQCPRFYPGADSPDSKSPPTAATASSPNPGARTTSG